MLVSLLGFLVVNRRLRARDAVLVAATAALSLESARNIALFVAAATPAYRGAAGPAPGTAARRPQIARRRQLPPFGVPGCAVLGRAGLGAAESAATPGCGWSRR